MGDPCIKIALALSQSMYGTNIAVGRERDSRTMFSAYITRCLINAGLASPVQTSTLLGVSATYQMQLNQGWLLWHFLTSMDISKYSHHHTIPQ